MTDLHAVALITAKPGSEETVREALTVLAGHTRDEEGCLRYELFESQAAPGTFVTVEEWTDSAALDAHMASAHIAVALEATAEAVAGPPAIHSLIHV